VTTPLAEPQQQQQPEEQLLAIQIKITPGAVQIVFGHIASIDLSPTAAVELASVIVDAATHASLLESKKRSTHSPS
jgi:hypothetical protein